MLTESIKTALRFCPDLPTPPAIAMQIVELARDPELELGQLVQLLAHDPALAGRLMRASNSCLFARRRKSESLRQAVVVIGLNATMTLALSFSLARTLHADSPDGQWVWRRALASSCAARLVADRLKRRDTEELALAALLQDIGVLALRAAVPEDYLPILREARDHEQLVNLERQRLGADHGEAGSWLLGHWQLPERLVQVPICTHGKVTESGQGAQRDFFGIVELSGKVADLLLGNDPEGGVEVLMRHAQVLDGLEREDLEAVLAGLEERLPETSALYETEIISESLLSGIVAQARQVLADRELIDSRDAHEYEQQRCTREEPLTEPAEQDVEEPDPPAQFDHRLDLEYRRATALGYPLSLAFVRIDHHRRLLTDHGANAIDGVVREVRRRLAGIARRWDLVFAFADDELVVLLPGMSQSRAQEILDRLRRLTAREQYQDAREQPFRVTLSIGMACHMDEGQLYARAIELLGAADQALRGPGGGSGDSLTLVC